MHEIKPVIGIVGGKGRMGKWFERFFREDVGLNVIVCDLNTDVTVDDIVKDCDVVIVSVPMEAFESVIKEIGPKMKHEAFLTDLCSLKSVQVDTMLKYTKESQCEVVGTHPLFGPAEDSIKGRRVAICPARGRRWLSWWEGLLKSKGALTYMIDAKEHDRTMAWVQALNHFILLSLGKALEEDGIDLNQLLNLATPSFERQLRIVSRLSLQDPELYATIQMSNPFTQNALNIFTSHANQLLEIIKEKDRAKFVELFKEVQELGTLLMEKNKKPKSF